MGRRGFPGSPQCRCQVTDHLKRMAAEAALAELAPGMRVGLGSGSTARHFIALLGARVAGGLECVGVPTSEATARLAREAGIPLGRLDEYPRLDVTVDGADEISPSLDLIKGGGGAMLREKIVASASDRMAVIADASKRVGRLGKFPLAIEVDPFGLGYAQEAIASIMRADGAEPEARLRLSSAGEPFVSDGGHLVIDAFFGRISDTKAVAAALDAVPGVIEHGLFLGLCDIAYIGAETGLEILRAGQAGAGRAN